MENSNGDGLWSNHISRMIIQMKESIQTLNGVWCEMGFNKERMCKRMDLVEMHCRDMFKTMVEEEEEYRSKLKLEIKMYTEEVKSLAIEMKEHISLDESWESLVVAESTLKGILDALKKTKEDRLRIYWKLKTQDKTTSLCLGVDEYAAIEGKVPTKEYLEDLKICVASKEAELERVKSAYCEKRETILSLMRELDKKPSTPLERNIASDDIGSIRLNKEFLNAIQFHHQELVQELQDRKELAIQLRETLSLLWDRLCVSPAVREAFHDVHPGHRIGSITALRKEIERCEELKRQNIKQFVEKLRTEIRDLWKKCLLRNEEELTFSAINSTNYTEELLELHELEVIRLKKECEDSKNVLEYLERWNRLFWKHVDLDDRVDDHDRLFVNRGGQLLKEEKERKAIQKELPKVETTLLKHYNIWCVARGRKFFYEGMELSEYIETRWNNYHEQKEIEKLERKRAKEMLLDQEAKLGTQVSGGKRKCALTPGKSPCASSAKLNRMDPTSGSRLKLIPINDVKRKTPSKHASRRLIEKPCPRETGEENVMAVPLPSPDDNVNHSLASTVATYADFTHHLEILSKDVNYRSSTLPEATPGDRHPTPLRPLNSMRLVPVITPGKQIPGSSRKIPSHKTPIKETAATPTRATCKTPGTPRTPQLRSLRSTSKSREIGSNIYTVQNVIDEVTSKSQIRKLVVLPYDLQIMEPKSESIKFITEFSKKTGDYHCLSATDIKVMALTYQMEIEHVGCNHLKSEPQQNRILNFTKQSTENPRDICGFYLPSKRTFSDEVNDHESLILSLPFLSVINEYLGDHTYLKGFSPSSLDLAVLHLLTSSGYPFLKSEVSASDSDLTSEEQLLHLTRWRLHITSIAEEVLNSLSKDDQVTEDDAANFIQHLVSSFYNREDNENTLTGQLDGLLIAEAEGHLDDDGFCDDENEDYEDHTSEDDDSDDDGWITPNNIKDAMKKMGGEIYEEKSALVGCITTDFAMQNVLKQIGLSVISQDGRVIKELRTHVLRCHACFHITNNPAGTSLTPGTRSTLQGASVVLGAGLKYQFCPKCGYQGTLKRVAVNVDKDGKQVVNVSCRRPITGKGKRFSVPRPKGGKHSNDPIICADQRVPQRHATRLARMKTDALNPDYIAGFSPFVMRDVNSRAAMLGIHGSELKHWLRKNPNENKLGRRRKK